MPPFNVEEASWGRPREKKVPLGIEGRRFQQEMAFDSRGPNLKLIMKGVVLQKGLKISPRGAMELPRLAAKAKRPSRVGW